MVLCFRCGAALPEGAAACPACGQDLAAAEARPPAPPASRSRLPLVSAAAAPYQPRALVAGRYRVEALLGVGPLGWVYRARDTQLEVEVALKVIDPALAASAGARLAFARQLRGTRPPPHPNLVRLHEEGEDQGRLYFTSQLVEGTSLRSLLEARRRHGTGFSVHQAEPLLAQVSAALEAAHQAGPHGDLKAENVLQLPEGLKVTDWGLALALPRPAFVQAQRGRGAGRHLAPELVAGGEVDARADVFSLGVLLEELVGPRASSGSGGLPALYRRAVDPDREARPPTAAAFLAELSAAVQALGPARPAPPPPPSPPDPASTRPMDVETLARALRQPEAAAPDPPGTVALPPPAPLAAPEEDEEAPGGFRWPVAGAVAALGLAVGVGLGLALVPRPAPLPLAVAAPPAVEPAPAAPPSAPAEVAPPAPAPPAGPAAGTPAGEGGPPAAAPPPRKAAAAGRVPACPEGMVGVPAQGRGRAFCIDVHEFPNLRGALPRTQVSYVEARVLCEQARKRLCTEAEWERACQGPAGTRWPYGDAFDPARCNTGDDGGAPRQLAPAGTFGRCRSGHGVVDLSGNVAEWTQERVLKGGSFASAAEASRCAARRPNGPRSAEVGLRCCAAPRAR